MKNTKKHIQRYSKMIVLLFMLLQTTSLFPQTSVNVKIDSLILFIGEQTGITLDVTTGAKDKIQMPALKVGDMLTPGIEIVEVSKQDTQWFNNNERIHISQKYMITSFDSTLYYIPPFVVNVDSTEYKTNSLALQVVSLPVDTLNLDAYYGFKSNMVPPFTWEDWSAYFWLSILLCLLVALLAYLYIRYRDNKPIIKLVKKAPQIEPHTLAIHEINQIKEEKIWAKEDSKEYYTRLTATLRIYIEKRFGFNAMEMTSAEIIEKLLEQNNNDYLEELKVLFNTADLVKFAKYNTLINENDMNLVNAIEFINQTKVEDNQPKQNKEEFITIEEKWKKSTLITVRVSLICLLTISILLFGYILWSVYSIIA